MAKTNMILLTVQKINQITQSTTFQMLFDPEKMLQIKLNKAGTAVEFSYPDDLTDPKNPTYTLYEVTAATLASVQSAMNSNSAPGKTFQIGVIDFALGHAGTGTYNIKDLNGNDIILPANSRVHNGYMETVTTFTGATATIALGYTPDGTTTAILGTTTATTLTAGTKTALTPVGTAAGASAKTTAPRQVILTVATAALTAGKAYVFLEIVTTAA